MSAAVSIACSPPYQRLQRLVHADNMDADTET